MEECYPGRYGFLELILFEICVFYKYHFTDQWYLVILLLPHSSLIISRGVDHDLLSSISPGTGTLSPLSIGLLVARRVHNHAKCVCAGSSALAASLAGVLVEQVRLIFIFLITHDLFEEAVAHSHRLALLLLRACLLNHVHRYLLQLVVEHSSLLRLIASLNVLLEHRVLHLRYHALGHLEIDKPVAVLRLQAVRHLHEELRPLQLLGLDFQDFLDEVILRVFLLLYLRCLKEGVCLVLERRGPWPMRL